MIVKYIFMFFIFVISLLLGNSISQKYKDRVLELRDFKSALNLLKAKIKYTYEPIPEIFLEISNKFNNTVGAIFFMARERMREKTAGESWELAMREYSFLNISKEDKQILSGLGKLLGKTSKEGQISEIELTEQFLDRQIDKAEEERIKNEKLHKTLGGIIGCALVIVLI